MNSIKKLLFVGDVCKSLYPILIIDQTNTLVYVCNAHGRFEWDLWVFLSFRCPLGNVLSHCPLGKGYGEVIENHL